VRIPSASNIWRERPVTSVGLLVDGDDYYRAFYRAAKAATREILLAGWQFDSDACLLRGPEAEHAELPVTLLAFLDALCRRNPDLRVYILAWDFHAVFVVEREWMQQQRFNWTTSDRLEFRFDSSHADGASHHQKFAVIDGELAFVGGLDLCDHRWDNRGHSDPNPLRLSRGTEHRPFHDVQAYLLGREAAGTVAEVFASRWIAAGGDPLVRSEPPQRVGNPWWDDEGGPRGAVPIASDRVAFSRTDPQGHPDGAVDCREVLALYSAAIDGAERFIYIENQYLSSQDIALALMQRMRATDRSRLDIVIVLNVQGDSVKEELATGLAQAKIIRELRQTAADTEHRLGVFYTVPATEGGDEPKRATYVHSKVMIVDDRFLTVGSANLTNRSMGLDTELNISFRTTADDSLAGSIRAVRHSLVAEHLGLDDIEAFDTEGMATSLSELAERKAGRLRIHPSPTPTEREAIDVIDPQQLPFDPGASESLDQDRSIFVEGLGALWKRLSGG
jgi:phosphatidylserine/phosphatidylglycerophosphate/cardiolipin synthase-like enzyme